MKSVTDILNVIGRKVLAERFGIKPQTVWHHENKASLPGNWYDGCCLLVGRDLPRAFFDWKPLLPDPSTKDVVVLAECTVEAAVPPERTRLPGIERDGCAG